MVSETTRKEWDRIYEMNIYEFFNIVSYARDKSKQKEKEIKEWRAKH